MINIITPDIKQQVAYAKRNVVTVRYIGLVVLIAGLLGAGFVFVHNYAQNQIAVAEERLAQHEAEVARFEELKQKVNSSEQQLSLVKQLLENQTRFSILLKDLSSVLPQGAFINNIALTGDASEPLRITLTTQSYQQAATVRNALLESERIEAADIQGVSRNREENVFTTDITVSFTEEGAR